MAAICTGSVIRPTLVSSDSVRDEDRGGERSAMMHRTRTSTALLAIAAAALLTGCSGGSGGHSAAPGPSATRPGSSAPTPAPSAGGLDHELVRMLLSPARVGTVLGRS